MVQAFAVLVKLDEEQSCYKCKVKLTSGSFALLVLGKPMYHCYTGGHVVVPAKEGEKDEGSKQANIPAPAEGKPAPSNSPAQIQYRKGGKTGGRPRA